MKTAVRSLIAGLGFGAATSLVNGLSSPYTDLGMPLIDPVWGSAAKVLSLLMDAGWAWAALAVAMGWLAGTRSLGALGGALSLMSATGSYYVTDTYIAGAGTDMVYWWTIGLPVGAMLGTVGAAIRQPGLTGLLAALVVPVGAGAQMIVLPPRPHLTLTPPIVLAEAIVWTGAALGASWAVYRYWKEKRTTTTG